MLLLLLLLLLLLFVQALAVGEGFRDNDGDGESMALVAASRSSRYKKTFSGEDMHAEQKRRMRAERQVESLESQLVVIAFGTVSYTHLTLPTKA